MEITAPKKSNKKRIWISLIIILFVIAVFGIIYFYHWFTYEAGSCLLINKICLDDSACGPRYCYFEKSRQIIAKDDLTMMDCNQLLTFRYLDYESYLVCLHMVGNISDPSFCFDEKSSLRGRYLGSNYKARMPGECVMDYALKVRTPEACFYQNALIDEENAIDFSRCYEWSGGNLTYEVCNRLPDSRVKRCCMDKANNTFEDC